MSLFEDLKKQAGHLESNRCYINECLKDYGLGGLSDDNFSVSYINRIDDKEFVKSFNEYLSDSSILANKLNQLIQSGEGEDRREIEKFDELKKHERIHYWVLWLHRCLRWIAGSLLVVFVYSLLVAAAESKSNYLNWVKIPIREWLISQAF